MLRSVFFLSLALSAVSMTVACGSDTSTTGDSGGASSSSSSGAELTIDQACAAYASAACAKFNSCSAPLFTLQYPDVATCEARIGILCPLSASAPGSSTPPQHWQDCADAAPSLSCDDVFSRNIPAACQPIAGSLADGSACGIDAQCMSAYCNVPSGEVCGVCGARSAAGGACKQADDCDFGLQCSQDKCVKPGELGATCDNAAPCLVTLACSGGKCAQAAGAGEACDPVEQNCSRIDGLGCNNNSVCQKVKFAGPGEVCGMSGGDFIVCSGNGTCKKSGANPAGTCLAPAKDGEACDEANGPKCMAGARCSSGLCKLIDPAACK